jgi:hypothetical protein
VEKIVSYEAMNSPASSHMVMESELIILMYLTTISQLQKLHSVECGGNMKVNGAVNVRFRRWSWPTYN